MAVVTASLIPRSTGYRVPGASEWLSDLPTWTTSVSSIRQRFDALVYEWHTDKRYMSSTDDVVSIAAYREIIGMGETVVPLILNELQRRPDHWFHALAEITGEDPVLPASVGRIRAMAKDWLDWGRTRGYVR